jgi:Domain of unknown function (DUF1707)
MGRDPMAMATSYPTREEEPGIPPSAKPALDGPGQPAHDYGSGSPGTAGLPCGRAGLSVQRADGEAPVMVEPGDEAPARAGGHGHLRASHADREQVIDTPKAAYVYGLVTKDEFDARVSRAFAARTHAGLALVTADIPAGLAAASSPPRPAPARGNPLVHEPQPGRPRDHGISRSRGPGHDSRRLRRPVRGVARTRGRR